MRVPNIWKQTNVTQSRKKNDTADVFSYRPISLQSTVSKVFEKKCAEIFNCLGDNDVMTVFQSGFVPGDPTANHLIDI